MECGVSYCNVIKVVEESRLQGGGRSAVLKDGGNNGFVVAGISVHPVCPQQQRVVLIRIIISPTLSSGFQLQTKERPLRVAPPIEGHKMLRPLAIKLTSIK
ncbi:unnamed protein product [Lota lota]